MKMNYNSSGGGKDKAAKSGGGDLATGLSHRAGMGGAAKGDAKGDTMPKGGSDPDYKVKKAGKSFTVC
jgi:hypothetical protein